jgi:hypothetical protein
MIMTRVSLVLLAVLCLSLSAQAQTSPLHLKVVGDVQTNKSLKVL